MNAKLKEKAKKSLKGNYLTLMAALLVFVIISSFSGAVAYLISANWVAPILTLVIESLIIMGLVKMVLKVSRNKKTTFNDLFSETELFVKYIWMAVILGVLGSAVTILESIAFKSLVVIMQYQADLNIFFAIFLIVVGLLLSVAILLFGLYITIAFSQCIFILSDEPKMPIMKVLSKSFDMMSNYILEYFILCLSFLGWLILGIFTLGILYLWLFPYILVTLANFYNKINKEYHETASEPESLLKQEDEIETLF